MPLTKEQLLKERYKAIADDTTQSFKSGDMLYHNDGWRYNVWQAPGGQYIFNPERFPHLFQLLPWWSDRKPQDMPEYLKINYNNGARFCKVNQWLHKIGDQTVFEYTTSDGIGIRETTRGTEPATEEEYTAYINQQQQQ